MKQLSLPPCVAPRGNEKLPSDYLIVCFVILHGPLKLVLSSRMFSISLALCYDIVVRL